ncbi:MAG: S8 family serine peptidase [Thermodesulfovibrionales bacterium]|nr:S8 family serine peptidase [Thermodesulfovibrionales bacterium]
MRKYLYLIICVFLVACGSQSSTNISSDTSGSSGSIKLSAQSILAEIENGGQYKDGELLVKFKSGVKAASSSAVHKTVGASVVRKYTIIPTLEHVKLPKGLSVKDAVMQYMANQNVEYAEPNYIRKTETIIPNDTYFANQWSFWNTGQYAYGTAGADIKMAAGWDVTIGSGDITIAVLDTGIDYGHNDLVWNIWRNLGEMSCTDAVDNDGNGYLNDCTGWNFIDNNNDPMDDYGHGTHVAGVIGAKGNNSTGIAGVMWLTNMMALKVCDVNGSCDVGAEIAAIDYAITMKNNHGVNVRAMNASFGGGNFSTSEYQAIDRANVAGILFVASAGNGGGDGVGDNNDVMPMYPASYNLPNIISVAATDQDDRRVSFSNFGPTSVDVAAPGTYIFSTVPNWWTMYYGYGHFEMFDGTSMAAPHVTGLAGLVSAYYAHFTHSQIRTMILRYVDVLPTMNGWILTGGRINADRALKSLWATYDLTATPVSSLQMDLAWTDRATDEIGYRIYRGTDGISYLQIAAIGVNGSFYSDAGLIDGTRYYYRVRAYNDIGESPVQQGTEATAFTPLNPPTNLRVVSASSTQIQLAWSDNSLTEQNYLIERRTSNTDFAQVGQVAQNTSTFTDTGLSPATTYWYRVRAFNPVAGYSAYSNEISGTTLTSGGNTKEHGGSGGCSVGGPQNTPTAFADLLMLLMPAIVLALIRRRS